MTKKKPTKEEVKQSVDQSKYVGATTAGLRAVFSQVFTFYVRVPVKLFRPTRIEYVTPEAQMWLY